MVNTKGAPVTSHVIIMENLKVLSFEFGCFKEKLVLDMKGEFYRKELVGGWGETYHQNNLEYRGYTKGDDCIVVMADWSNQRYIELYNRGKMKCIYGIISDQKKYALLWGQV